MKKIFAFAAIIFIFSLTVFAEGAVFTLSEAEGERGDTVKLTLSLTCDKEANSFAVARFTFDVSALEMTGFSDYEALEEITALPPMFDIEKQTVVFGLKKAQSYNGKVCDIEFKIKEGATLSQVQISADTVAKNNSVQISSSFVSGNVKIANPLTKPNPTVNNNQSTVVTPVQKVWKNPFADVKSSDWYYGAVKYTNENGIINGVSKTEFAPMSNVTRAMFVTLLYRLENEPETKECTFLDVVKNSWYEKAVAWANEKGIVYGISQTHFAPDSNITREQMSTILYRWAKYKGNDISLSSKLLYSDSETVSDWAKESVLWTTQNGIMKGSGNAFLPQNCATRAEAATVIMRISELKK